ncbi:family 2 encapsulin nanocompartment cargo protein terpene cyclase [Saccharopolyspora shandongensis]|uniref:family 2 encapsulin nanocompartment cargo protein terpene cyclase n=1 Tax=Saccharopolyspora shandongensis TaxID=418495 RepID=UPI00343F7C63
MSGTGERTTSDPSGLAMSLLTSMAGAPPVDLSRLLTDDGRGEPARLASVRRFATGPGTAALRFPHLPADAPVPSPRSAPTGLGATTPRTRGDRAEDDYMPELFCPGPMRDDPALGQEVDDRLVEWAEQVGIYPGRLDKLAKYGFGRLITLAHPGTDDPDRLLAAAKCVVAEWATDDYFIDEVELGADPKIVGSRLAKLHAVVDPAPLAAQYAPQLDEYRTQEPLATAFRTAMEHLARYASVPQMARFQHQMSILFVAWNQEADWHANGRTPPVWEYLVQRHLNSYLPPMILVDAVAGYELSPTEFYHPRVRHAFTMAGDANVLLNDLHSADFESENDFNLPRVIAREENCSYREALKRTVEIHNELMHAFVAEAAALSAVGSPALRRFFLDTWAWLGGSREWHATTGRYQRGDVTELSTSN